MPIVIAQHMPPLFTSLLAERLASKCSMDVREAKSGELLAPGYIWIAPGDYHLVVSQEGGVVHLRTHQEPRENFCRPSVDVLFRSVAEVFGGRALGVVLTGMGQDGLKGCEVLHAGGSHIIVQDEASSVVWGMPGFVARAGLADKILGRRLSDDLRRGHPRLFYGRRRQQGSGQSQLPCVRGKSRRQGADAECLDLVAGDELFRHAEGRGLVLHAMGVLDRT